MGKRILSLLLALVLAVGMFPAVALAEPAHVHKMSFAERKEPTCTEDGHLAHYHCEGCGKNFEDEEGQKELKDVVLPAIGHDWGDPSYVWAEDGSACSAKRICRNDPSHEEKAEGQITRTQTGEPGVDFPGEITCTAVFEAEWAEKQTMVLEGTLKDYNTLTYVTGGGMELQPEMFPEGTTVPLNRVPVRIGYTFTGWYSDENLTQRTESAEMTENRTVYAGWEVTPAPAALESELHPAYLAGYAGNCIQPGSSITRAETATIFFRLLCLENRQDYLTKACDFTDVAENAWYRVQISTIAEMGILNGRGNHHFAPDSPITRAEFATICVRFAGEIPESGCRIFTDIQGHWAEKTINRAACLGWIGGYEDGSFHPDSLISRAEAVTIVNRMLHRLPRNQKDLLPGMHVWADCRPDQWFYLAVQEASNGHSYERQGETGEKWTGLQPDTIWSATVNYRGVSCFDLGKTESYSYAADFASALGLRVESDRPLVLGTRDRVTFENGKITVNGRDTGKTAEILYDSDGRALLPLTSVAGAMNLQVHTRENGRAIDILAEMPRLEVTKGVNVPVLMYHAVSDDTWGIEELFVSPSNMDKQLAYLVNHGYDPIWFEDLTHLEDYDKPVLLTFDDGYDDNYTELFPLLKKYHVKATIFVIGGGIGFGHAMNRKQIREMSDSGLVSIQSHGYSHNNMDVMDEATLEFEMSKTKEILTEITGKVPYVLCYPSGRNSTLTRKVAQRYYQFGIKMTGGLYNTSHDQFLVNRYYVSRQTDIYSFAAMISRAGT